MEHVQHAVALAGAQVAHEQSALALQFLHRRHVALGQIHHMDIVPHAGAVGGGVVVAVDVKLFQLTHRHLGNIRHQVVGDAVGVLAHQAGLVGADGVEVAQQRHVQRGVCGADVGQDALLEQLGGAVGIGGASGGEVLPNGHGGGVAVHRGGGGEHEVLHPVAAHGLEQVQGADQVVGVVLQGLGHALAHRLEPGEVDDRVDAGVLGKQGLHLVLIAQLRLDEGDLFPCDLLHPDQGLLAGVVQVVRHHDVVAGVEKLHTGVAADITGAAADQNRHKTRSLSFINVPWNTQFFLNRTYYTWTGRKWE